VADWTAERVVDERLAAELIAAQFPQLAGREVSFLGAGWDDTVYVVDGTLAFRFPRRQMGLDCQRRELLVLAHLPAHLPLAVPAVELLGQATAAYPWPFWGGPVLPGDELADAPHADRTAMAGQVGAFLRVLHDLDAPSSLPVDPMARGWPRGRLSKTRDALSTLGATGAWDEDPAVVALVERAAELEPAEDSLVLVHGDLHARHLLVGPDGRASGVIDWGDACLADPAVDLSLLYSAFEPADRQVALSSYGDVPAHRELRARSLAIGLSAALAAYAATEGHDRLLTESLAGLRRAVA
jgi:aminoglycoside phosphotransferase (APT) family kinase protein